MPSMIPCSRKVPLATARRGRHSQTRQKGHAFRQSVVQNVSTYLGQLEVKQYRAPLHATSGRKAYVPDIRPGLPISLVSKI